MLKIAQDMISVMRLMQQSYVTEFGWKPKYTFETGIEQTIKWYLDNQDWWQNIISGEYQEYFKSQYGDRLEVE